MFIYRQPETSLYWSFKNSSQFYQHLWHISDIRCFFSNGKCHTFGTLLAPVYLTRIDGRFFWL
jgi:hypothetical protein